MDYFLINEMDGPAISISAGFDKNIQSILQERYRDIEDMCMYRMQIPETVCLPDVLFRPSFMMSEPCWECVQYYEPYLEARRCLLYDRDGSGIFYIPLLETAQCLSDKKELFNRHIFRIRGNKKHIVISLDLIESLLRRDYIGFNIKEI